MTLSLADVINSNNDEQLTYLFNWPVFQIFNQIV